MQAYDSIAEEYGDSKQLPFREHLERYTLFQLLGDVSGKTVLDMACGEGFYTRLLKRAGASEVTGVDISTEMIRLAEDREARHPLGCRYVRADAARFQPEEPVDLVVALYLFNYAETGEQLRQFCQVCHDALKSGGSLIGVNDDVRNVPTGTASLRKYGLERSCPNPAVEGDVIRYTITNADGRRFQFDNFYLTPETYEVAFQKAGFREFHWVDVRLHSSQKGNSFWDDFLSNPPIAAFTATR
jgi:SAM-dependent methyltransferase